MVPHGEVRLHEQIAATFDHTILFRDDQRVEEPPFLPIGFATSQRGRKDFERSAKSSTSTSSKIKIPTFTGWSLGSLMFFANLA